MSLRDRVKRYAGESATATPAIPATHERLRVATVAGVAVATNQNINEALAERWQWFISLATEHGIHPHVAEAEFPTEQDRLDVVEPATHTNDKLRQWMATLCTDDRVRQRQQDYTAGRWLPVDDEVLL